MPKLDPATNHSPVERTVVRLVQEALAGSEHANHAVSLADRLFAGGLGIDSLTFATLIVRLEQQTGLDPFRTGLVGTMPQTVADLASLYQQIDNLSASQRQYLSKSHSML